MESTKPKPTEEQDELFDLKPAGPLNEEEEKNLAEFLKKVGVACQNDSSVPSEVGAQVQSWLKEMEEESGELQADCGGS